MTDYVWVLTKHAAYEEEIIGVYSTDAFMSGIGPREEWETEHDPDALAYYDERAVRYVAKRWPVKPS